MFLFTTLKYILALSDFKFFVSNWEKGTVHFSKFKISRNLIEFYFWDVSIPVNTILSKKSYKVISYIE